LKERLKINNISAILSIFGLVLLLLLSPCKVRNYIQSELGITQTKVLNKSQSTISQSDCQTFDVSETVQKISKQTLQQSDLITSEIFRLEGNFESFYRPRYSCPSRKNSTAVVPLYILFQNLKIYS